MKVRFSIIVVTLNAGDKLIKTIESIIEQDYDNYEIIVKDGLSNDNSIVELEKLKNEKIAIHSQKDTGIYDAMNQGAQYASGDYVYFLNCGDYFNSKQVLSKTSAIIDEYEENNRPGIVYGNILQRTTGQMVMSNPQIDAFACYRNVPCHQTSFFKRELVLEHHFRTEYKIRADYEQFLWCFFEKKTSFRYFDLIIVDYEGDGFSETKDNLKLSKKEHKDITRQYMSKGQLFKYRFIMIATLAPLRTAISKNQKTAKFYNNFKKLIYKGKSSQ